MRCVCILYYLSTDRYTYGMIILIKSDNDRYDVIWYLHKEIIYSHIYSSTEVEIKGVKRLGKGVLIKFICTRAKITKNKKRKTGIEKFTFH